MKFNKKISNISPCLSAFIGLTDKCNLNCRHCYSIKNNVNAKAKEISYKDVSKIADSLNKLGIFSVQLSGGEPLLRKDFLKICNEFSKRGISLLVNTNGMLLNKKILLKLKKMNLSSLQISLDSVDKKNLEYMRGKKGIHNKIINSIKLAKKVLGDKICIGCVLTSYNADDIENVAKFAKSNSIKLAFIPLLTTGRANKSIDLGIKEKLSLIKKIKNYPDITLVVPPVFNKIFKIKNIYRYCSFPYHVAVMPNGDVFPCSGLRHVEKLKLGNINKTELGKIYSNSSLLNKLRSIKPKSLKGVCSNCVFKQECMGGCRAAAYLAYNSFDMPDPICQNLYDIGKFPEKYLKKN